MIHHYTDATGLIGIIESKVIRATSAWFMNDAAEATFGWEQVERFIASKAGKPESEERVLGFILDAIHGLRDRNDFPDSYISCFSQKADLLSQWRAYGHGNGFSIGFDQSTVDELAQAISPAMPPPATRKVAYTQAEYDMMLDSHYHREVASQLSRTDLTAVTLAHNFVYWAILTAPSIKHHAFQEEAEVRLHFFGSNPIYEVSFRSSAMGVTPYIEMPLCKSKDGPITAIREVIIGPQRHSAEARRAVQKLLSRNGLEDVTVKTSQVPLRA